MLAEGRLVLAEPWAAVRLGTLVGQVAEVGQAG